MKKLVFITLIFVIIIFCSAGVYAANCNATTACNCGDTLIGSRTLNASDNLTGCSGNGLTISTSNLVLDCDGYDISGDSSGPVDWGVGISSANNITIKNCNISNFEPWAVLVDGGNNTLYNNTLINCGTGIATTNSGNNFTNNIIYKSSLGTTRGIYLNNGADNNSLINNTIYNYLYGVQLGGGSNDNLLKENNLYNNSYGIYMASSSNVNTIYHNNIYNSNVNEVYSDAAIELSYNYEGNYWGRTNCPVFIAGTDSNAANVVDSYAYNSMDGWLTENPLACCGSTIHNDVTLTYNLTGCSGNGLNIAAAGVTLDCDGYTISGSGSSTGVNVSNSDNAVVHNCTITNFNNGIGLDLSDNVDLTYNNITGGATGIFVFQSAITTIQNNDISGTSTNAITLSQTGSNQIISNNIHDNSHVGISMLSTAGSNNITLNNITGCQDGIQVGTTTSKIYNNNIYNNSGYSAVAYSAVNLSYNQEGNYWGRTSCPVFIAGTDSSRTDAIDYYPYNISDGWLTGSPTICDTAGPSVTITVPSSGAKIPSITNYNISGSVTDATLVSTITVTMMPVFTGTATYNSSDDTWSFVADMTAAIDGYYNITVNATDLYGNYNTAEAINVEVDGTPPTISSVSSSVSSSGAGITWTTDENSDSRVDYGTNASLLGSTSSNAAYTTSNSVSLSGLSASTLYYYNVTSCDQIGNCRTEGVYNFTTSAEPEAPETPAPSRRSRGGISVSKNNIGNTPKTVVMNRVDKAIFTVKGNTHYAQIKNILSNYITVTVRSSEAIDVDLYIGKTAKVDVDEDGIFDIAMTLEEIYSSSAEITFQVIEELVPEEMLAKETSEEKRIIIEEKVEVSEELPPIPEIEEEVKLPPEEEISYIPVIIAAIFIVITAAIGISHYIKRK
ncbi:right-handed parallel beta-helix repeat-containing protein [Candidatus Woesearchaeota archaeon]|nr:right-handed parallel beta-helix repeat-containing protein [Candidatus Woesearchaeota archaeon]